MPRPLVIVLKWLAAVAVVGNLCWLAYDAHDRRINKARATNQEKQADTPKFLEEGKITLTRKVAESYGLAIEPAREGTWRERAVVYGRVVPNPSATYEVRSPFAGTLQTAGEAAWPALGQTVRPGQPLGRVAVRFGPQERLDLLAKLSEARLKQKGAEEVRRLRQTAVDRLSSAKSALVQRDLDEALVQLADAQTQVATAKGAVELLEQALTEIDGASEPGRVVRLTQNKPGLVGLGVQPAPGAAAWSRSLAAPEGASGTELEITELAGQPGTAVEAGGLVMRLVDFSRILVRLDFPAEATRTGPPPREVDLTAMPGQRGNTNGGSSASVKGDLVGPAPQVDAASQFVGYWYAVRGETRPSVLGKTHASPSVWRPGLFLQSAVESSSSTEQEAISVPAKAVLYHQGRAWVYRLHDSSTSKEVVYLRREVEVLGYEGDRCILAPPSLDLLRGVSAGDDIVADHPQVLLSTEFRPEADPD